MAGDDIVFVEVGEVLKETDAALLLDCDTWVPKSQIADYSEVQSEGDLGTLALKRWIADEKGLDYDEGEPCGNCDATRPVGKPCLNCKFQPESEWRGEKEKKPRVPTKEWKTVEKEIYTPAEVAEATEQAQQEADHILGDDEAEDLGGKAAEVDVCPTPYELALAICQRVAQTVPAPATVLEPSAGEGAFVRAAHAVWPNARIIAVEPRASCEKLLREAGADEVFVGTLEDFAHTEAGLILGDVDLVIGNPPFSLAEPHIRLLLGAMREEATLAFLLRVGFYEARKATRGQPLEERLRFWREYPETSFAPIYPRPGFTLNSKGKVGTDSQTYGLFRWVAGFAGDPSVREPHVTWEKKRADKATTPKRSRKPRKASSTPAKLESTEDDTPVLE